MKWYLISILVFPASCLGQLKLANIFSDNMVLQRDKPVHIWGNGIPGKTITVSFAKEIKKVVVKPDSSWRIYFKNKLQMQNRNQFLCIAEQKKLNCKTY